MDDPQTLIPPPPAKDTESEKQTAEFTIKYRELALKEIEQKRLGDELLFKQKEAKFARWSNPLIVAVLGGLFVAMTNILTTASTPQIGKGLTMRVLIAMLLLTSGALPMSACQADDERHVLAECAPGGTWDATTCDCFARHLPQHHLVGGTGPKACDFLSPPPVIEPCCIFCANLNQWGIPDEDLELILTLRSVRTTFAWWSGSIRERNAGMACASHYLLSVWPQGLSALSRCR